MRYAKGLTSFGIDGGFSALTGHNPFSSHPSKGLLKVDLSGDRDPPTAAGFGSSGFYGQGLGYFSPGGEVSVITDAEVGIADIGKIAPFHLET